MEHSEIRAMLEKITQGKWRWNFGYLEVIWGNEWTPMTGNDKEFVIASPPIVRQLLEEAEKLTAELESYRANPGLRSFVQTEFQKEMDKIYMADDDGEEETFYEWPDESID